MGSPNNDKIMTKRMKNTEGSSSKMMRGVQSILELPIGILYEIISRLPLQAIRSCKCVCKTYRNIIKDPHFAKLHLSKEQVTSAALIVLNSEPHSSHFPPYMLDLDVTHSGHLTCDQHLLSWPRGFTREYVKEYFCTNNVSLVSSCNGLLCLNSIALEDPLFYIYNPLGGECMTLPTLESYSLDSHYYVDSGFGFCPTSKKYKVICFMRGLADPEGSSVLVLVHTVGTDSWRIIGNVPCPMYRGSFDSLLGGFLHWIGDNSETPESICSFDLEKELFEPLPMPPHFVPEYASKISWISVGVLGQSLCVCYTLNDTHFEVSVMKKYGVRESWVKHFVIDIRSYNNLEVSDFWQPVKFWNNGEFLFITKEKILVSYNPRNRNFIRIKNLDGLSVQVLSYVPSLVTLKTALLEKPENRTNPNADANPDE